MQICKLPLGNVTNILNSASSLLPQTSTTNSSNKENAPKAPTTGAKRGPKSLPRDPVTGAIIRPRDAEGNLIVKTRKPKNLSTGQYGQRGIKKGSFNFDAYYSKKVTIQRNIEKNAQKMLK